MNFKSFLFLFMALFTATATMAQADFNFSFYPAPTYTKIESYHVRDTITKQILVKNDTTTKVSNVLIEKQNGHLTVRLLSDVSKSLYDSDINFAGVFDGGAFVYNSTGKDHERIVFQPGKNNTLEIVFQTCVDESVTSPNTSPDGAISVKKYCDTTRHIFGRMENVQVKPLKLKN